MTWFLSAPAIIVMMSTFGNYFYPKHQDPSVDVKVLVWVFCSMPFLMLAGCNDALAGTAAGSAEEDQELDFPKASWDDVIIF